MKTPVKILLLVLVLGAALWLFLRPASVPVSTELAIEGTAVDTVLGNVTVEPAYQLPVRSRETGMVLSSLAEPQSPAVAVEKGQTILQLDSRLVHLQIQSLNAEIEALQQRQLRGSPEELTLDNLRQDLEIKERLAQLEQSSRSDLQKLRRDVARLERQITTQKLDWETDLQKLISERDQLQLGLENMTIVAPATGLLTEFDTDQGQYVFVGDLIATLLSPEPLVSVSLSEDDLPGIAIGQDVRVRFPALGDVFYPATVTAFAPLADRQQRRREVFVKVDLPEDAPLSGGMTGEASVIRQRRPGAVIIPRRALLDGHVFVVEGGVARQRSVEVGFYGLKQAEILSGVEVGQRVVTSGQEALSDGQRVDWTSKE